jgi:hypothetical protein
MNEDQNIIRLWKNQPLAASELDMQLVITQAQKFQRKIRLRNLTEYLACGGLVAWAASFMLRSAAPPLMKAGIVLIALGGLAVAAILRLRGHAARREPPLAASTREALGWHRSELIRQRELLRAVPLWYLGPFVPGVATTLIGAWLTAPGEGLRVALTAALVAVVFAGVALLNRRAASKLDEQIAKLAQGLEG